MQYIIQETYEYLVEADSLDKALEAHEKFMEDGDNAHVVSFTQNYTTVLDNDGKEI